MWLHKIINASRTTKHSLLQGFITPNVMGMSPSHKTCISRGISRMSPDPLSRRWGLGTRLHTSKTALQDACVCLLTDGHIPKI